MLYTKIACFLNHRMRRVEPSLQDNLVNYEVQGRNNAPAVELIMDAAALVALSIFSKQNASSNAGFPCYIQG